MNIHTCTINKNRGINEHHIYAYETSHTITQYKSNTSMLHVHHTDERILARIHIINIDNFPTKLRFMLNLMNNLVGTESRNTNKFFIGVRAFLKSLMRIHRYYFVRC